MDRLPLLAEHEDTEGLFLWRIVRDVELWSSTPEERQNELFSTTAPKRRAEQLRAAKLPEDVRPSLGRICAGLDPGAESSAREEISESCAAVAFWAREIEARETAVAFAQAAAAASPHVARYAYVTAACCLDLDQRARAWTWYERAVGLARRERDSATCARGYLALARLAHGEAMAVRARALYLRALRTARRWGVLDVRAGAAFGLFTLARAAGEAAQADRWAAHATRLVLKLQPDTADLALTLSAFWIERGDAARAELVLRRLRKLGALTPAATRTATVLLARALPALVPPQRAGRAWEQAWRVLQEGEGAAADFVHLARAAADLRDTSRLARAGRAALVHASPAEYPDVHAELRALAAGRVDFGPPLAGAA